MSETKFKVSMIPANQISYQPDKAFSRFQQVGTNDYIRTVTELSENIKAIGLLHPITVIETVKEQGKSQHYICAAGNRRLAAMAEILKWEEIPCVIKDDNNFLLAFSEQCQRTDLTEIERGCWIDRAIDLLKKDIRFTESKSPTIEITAYLGHILGKSPRTLESWRSMAKKFTPEERARVTAGESAYTIQKNKQATSTDAGGRPTVTVGAATTPATLPKVLTAEEKATKAAKELAKERGKHIKKEATKFIALSEKIRLSLTFIAENDLEFRNNKQVQAAFKALAKAMTATEKHLAKKPPIVAVNHV